MTVDTALEDLNNAILDLQQADYNTFERPLRQMAAALKDSGLKEVNDRLIGAVNFDEFIESSDSKNSLLGSAQLNWPSSKEHELGLVLHLIERAGNDPAWLSDFAFYWYHSGSKISAGIHKLTRSIFIPFLRDYKLYLARNGGSAMPSKPRIFVVHGHDEAAKEAVARFVEKMGCEAVILHEQASRGMTIPEKLDANAGVDFAVVLLTPDDEGRKKGGETHGRARQNVIFELGYFVAKLGKHKVCALVKGDVEIPTDYLGTVYTQLDDASSWKIALAIELKAAGYPIDLNSLTS
ncbi:MAG: nucleotide-binding protein [Paracoccus sp. (in: a-proteobacteria)]|nr:nucleotide-binding protein [Paracoccus sp. (in: a-proteobacteria)]